MILAEVRNDVEASGIGEVGDFKMAFTTEAYAILSSTMYSDDISAILRETGVNALDSAIEAGRPEVPFDLKMPNYLDPTFYIRDYGTGLSDDDIKNIYTSYFTTTKSKTNTQTGGFGIGAKSLFYYTKNFSVTSFQDGMEHAYAIFENERGLPSYTKLYNKKTSEKDGLKVSFPVKSGDFNDFTHKAAKIYRWFKVRPNILGGTLPECSEFNEEIMKGDSWTLYKNSDYYKKSAYVLMGSILYKTNRNTDVGNVVLEAPIGSVDITASREDLKYTARTEKFLNDATGVFEQEKCIKFQEKLDSCESMYDARIVAVNNPRFVNEKSEYKGEIVRPSYNYVVGLKSEADGIIESNRLRYRKGKERVQSQSESQFTYQNDAVFVELDDKTKSVSAKLRNYLQTNKNVVIIFSCSFLNGEQKKSFLEKIGLPETRLIKIKSLPNPPKDTSSGSVKMKKTQIKKVILTSNFRTGQSLINEDYSNTTEGVYVLTDSYTSDSWRVIHDFHYNIIRLLSMKDVPNFYLIKNGFDLSNSKMISLETYKENLKKKFKNEEESAKYVYITEDILKFEEYKDIMPDNIQDDIEIAKKVNKESNKYWGLNRLFNESAKVITWFDDYPMIKFVGRYLDKNDEKMIRDYIIMVSKTLS